MSGRGEFYEVFASPHPDDIRERALVLRAQGIPYQELQRGSLHLLAVEEFHTERALRELSDYETENRDWPPVETVPPGLPGARLGTLVFGLVLVLFHTISSANLLRLGWYEKGAAHAERILDGEVWRCFTALFLHTGPVHLFSNVIFGALFGFSAAHSLGGGLGWCAILIAGALGNLTNAWMSAPGHISVGASTAVFAAVGLLGGTEWRRRNLLRQRRLRRAAPVVMVLVILAFHGIPTTPDRVDVGAHVLGLAWGLILGALLPSLLARGWGKERGQRWAVILAASLVAAAWSFALRTDA